MKNLAPLRSLVPVLVFAATDALASPDSPEALLDPAPSAESVEAPPKTNEGPKPRKKPSKVVVPKTVPCIPIAEIGDPIGRVLSVSEGVVVLRKLDGVAVRSGSRIAFHDKEGDETVVGTILKVNNKTYHVGIAMNEDVHPGDLAYASASEESGSLAAPPVADYTWAIGAEVRPWLGLSGKESGAQFEGFVSARLSERFRFRAAVEPASPHIGSTSGALEAYGALSVVFHLAEIGFGVGAGTANYHYPSPPGLGILFTPTLRFGAEDGFVFYARSSAVIHDGQAVFGSFRLDMEIPVAYGTKLLAGGGGGDSGYAYGEVGLKRLMVGNGGRGSWFAQVTFGGAGTHATPMLVPRQHEGPFMGLGFERRL